MSRESLVQTYISGLQLTLVAVSSATCGRSGTIVVCHAGEPAPNGKIKFQFYFRSSGHAELVLAAIGKAGLSGKPAVLAASIERAAAMLGAPVMTSDELRKVAEIQVAEITARVRASNQSGGLKVWNTRFKQYRLAQVEKREPAIPYSVFLEQFVITPTVRDVAASGRAL